MHDRSMPAPAAGHLHLYAERLRLLRDTNPDRYQIWFGDQVDLTADDRTVAGDALIAERPDMTIVETGDQLAFLLWGGA